MQIEERFTAENIPDHLCYLLEQFNRLLQLVNSLNVLVRSCPVEQ